MYLCIVYINIRIYCVLNSPVPCNRMEKNKNIFLHRERGIALLPPLVTN